MAAAPAPDLVFAEKSDWEIVSSGHRFAEGMAWDDAGHFYFTDVPAAQLYKIDPTSGEKSLVDAATGRANGIAFGPERPPALRLCEWRPMHLCVGSKNLGEGESRGGHGVQRHRDFA